MKSTESATVTIDGVSDQLHRLRLDPQHRARLKAVAKLRGVRPGLLEKYIVNNQSQRENGNKCHFASADIEDLDAFRDLGDKYLLLLTPVLEPFGQHFSLDKHIDPFEYFGRELHRYHRAIRHVPYVPEVGLTSTHAAWIKSAGAVVMVICEPHRHPRSKAESLEKQLSFLATAREVWACRVKDYEFEQFANSDDPDFLPPKKMVVLQCASDKHRTAIDSESAVVVQASSYDAEVAREVAYAIFRTEV